MTFPSSSDVVRGTSGNDDIKAISNTGAANGPNPGGGSYLSAGAGDDIVRGGKYDDVILGGAGNDSLWGGSGADQFRFSGNDMQGNSETDRIYDLNFAEGDKLVFNDFGAGTFQDIAGGNPLQILNGGASAILDSWADVVELVNASANVTATGSSANGLLFLQIDGGALGIQTIRITGGWSHFEAAGGVAGA